MKIKVVPAVWNLSGKTWNSGLTWNGTTTITQIMTTKAIIDFGNYSAPELTPVAQTIHDQMTANAATFPAPPTAMPALATLITTYGQKLAARASNATVDVLAFQVARAALEGALHDIGIYINLIAKGDAMIVEKSGFPSYSMGGGATPGPGPVPGAPQNVKLRNGDLPSSVIARHKPDRPNSVNVAQINTGNPNDEAGWKTAAHGTGSKITITGLIPGTILWVRIATVGPGGQLGAWSDPAKIVVA